MQILSMGQVLVSVVVWVFLIPTPTCIAVIMPAKSMGYNTLHYYFYSLGVTFILGNTVGKTLGKVIYHFL